MLMKKSLKIERMKNSFSAIILDFGIRGANLSLKYFAYLPFFQDLRILLAIIIKPKKIIWLILVSQFRF